MSRRFDPRDESGVVIILVALAMTSLLIIAAIVIDLGYVRGTARADQSIADLAALAGGEDLENERQVDACEAMVDYLNRNAKDMPSLDAGDFCVDMDNTVCTDGTLDQAVATTTSGKYTITIEFPVPDEPGAYPAMGAGAEDGPPCDRMRLTVDSLEPAFFGGVIGTDEYQVARSATLRAGPGETAKAPALWLLEPYGCNSLATGGAGTSIVVGDMSAVPPIEGLVTVDSNATQSNGSGGCSGGATTVDVSQGQIHALPTSVPTGSGQEVGQIRLVAMARSAQSCVIPACDPADVLSGRLAPTPIPVPRRATRAPVDHRWNCKTGYPAYDVGTVGIPRHRHPGLCDGRGGPALHRPAPLPGRHVRCASGVRHLPEARCAVRQVQRHRCGGAPGRQLVRQLREPAGRRRHLDHLLGRQRRDPRGHHLDRRRPGHPERQQPLEPVADELPPSRRREHVHRLERQRRVALHAKRRPRHQGPVLLPPHAGVHRRRGHQAHRWRLLHVDRADRGPLLRSGGLVREGRFLRRDRRRHRDDVRGLLHPVRRRHEHQRRRHLGCQGVPSSSRAASPPAAAPTSPWPPTRSWP